MQLGLNIETELGRRDGAWRVQRELERTGADPAAVVVGEVGLGVVRRGTRKRLEIPDRTPAVRPVRAGLMTAEEAERLAELASNERRARRACASRSSAEDMRIRDAWAEWLPDFFPGDAWFTTLTYSDPNGKRLKAYTPRSCFGDAHRWLMEAEYKGPSLNVVEPHKYRDILHLHGLLAAGSSMPGGDEEARLLRGLWEATRGFARISPAVPAAFPYVTKYALKSAPGNGADCVDLQGLYRG